MLGTLSCPYAVVPLVRICAGAASNDRPYRDPFSLGVNNAACETQRGS